MPSDNHFEKQRYRSTHGPGEIAYVRGSGVAAAAAGMGAKAIAGGDSATAAAAGRSAHAIIRRGGDDGGHAAAAVGFRSIAESYNSTACLAAVGIRCCAISHREECPAVAVGYEPTAVSTKPGGTAVAVGDYGMASAGPGGHLVFVDTNCAGGPVARVFAVGKDGSSQTRFTASAGG